jgi:hypothetical protein
MILVYGANLAGRHGAGAALKAVKEYGAEHGKVGPHGRSYGIPTKTRDLKPLSLREIQEHVAQFLDWARLHPEETFWVTDIGCGLAGHTHEEIGPMFASAPDNCVLSADFDVYRRRAR